MERFCVVDCGAIALPVRLARAHVVFCHEKSRIVGARDMVKQFIVVRANNGEWWYSESIACSEQIGNAHDIEHVIDWGASNQDEQRQLQLDWVLRYTEILSRPSPNKGIVELFSFPCRITGEPCANHLQYEDSSYPVSGRGWHCSKCFSDQSYSRRCK